MRAPTEPAMKKDIHPNYRPVLFRDVSCGFEFLTRSCIQAKSKAMWNGEEVPLVEIDISSQSHPFFTGTQKILDTEGRVDRFYRKYGFAQPSGSNN
jgi:large subunit ribosomal protein L31